MWGRSHDDRDDHEDQIDSLHDSLGQIYDRVDSKPLVAQELDVPVADKNPSYRK